MRIAWYASLPESAPQWKPFRKGREIPAPQKQPCDRACLNESPYEKAGK